MSHIANTLIGCVLFLSWLAGIVLAKGFWWTLAATTLVLPAWYLVVERLMSAGGLT